MLKSEELDRRNLAGDGVECVAGDVACEGEEYAL